LGFSAAIRELCREVSSTLGIEVEFKGTDVPESLSSDEALCLYRIAQEALQNIAKHSHSKTAWVHLTGAPQELRLCIWDEGIGFDTESPQRGLGLVSMRERLRLVGGSLRISSRAPSGTQIDATVPLNQGR
jgi:signal transduction histidine kinase